MRPRRIGRAGNLVDRRHRAARAQLHETQPHGRRAFGVEMLDEILFVCGEIRHDDVRSEAVHGNRRCTFCGEPRVQVVERRLADHEQRVTVRELRVRIDLAGPFAIAAAARVGPEARELRGHAEEFGEPRGRFGARVDRVDGVAPDGRGHFRRGGRYVAVERRADLAHARCVQHERIAVERGADQREARVRALRDHLPVGVGDQPVAVVRQARFEQLRARQRDAGAGFDRIDEEFGDGWHDAG